MRRPRGWPVHHGRPLEASGLSTAEPGAEDGGGASGHPKARPPAHRDRGRLAGVAGQSTPRPSPAPRMAVGLPAPGGKPPIGAPWGVGGHRHHRGQTRPAKPPRASTGTWRGAAGTGGGDEDGSWASGAGAQPAQWRPCPFGRHGHAPWASPGPAEPPRASTGAEAYRAADDRTGTAKNYPDFSRPRPRPSPARPAVRSNTISYPPK